MVGAGEEDLGAGGGEPPVLLLKDFLKGLSLSVLCWRVEVEGLHCGLATKRELQPLSKTAFSSLALYSEMLCGSAVAAGLVKLGKMKGLM